MDSAVFAMATNRFDLTPSTSIYNASQSKKEICDMCAQVLVSRAALDEGLVVLCENRWGSGQEQGAGDYPRQQPTTDHTSPGSPGGKWG